MIMTTKPNRSFASFFNFNFYFYFYGFVCFLFSRPSLFLSLSLVLSIRWRLFLHLIDRLAAPFQRLHRHEGTCCHSWCRDVWPTEVNYWCLNVKLQRKSTIFRSQQSSWIRQNAFKIYHHRCLNIVFLIPFSRFYVSSLPIENWGRATSVTIWIVSEQRIRIVALVLFAFVCAPNTCHVNWLRCRVNSERCKAND